MTENDERPVNFYMECPDCDDETLHENLNPSARGVTMPVRCTECGRTDRVEYSPPGKELQVRTIVSEGPSSERTTLTFEADSSVAIDDIVYVGDVRCKVTGIEMEEFRMETCPVVDVTTLWVTKYETIKVKISLQEGHKSIPLVRELAPEDTIVVGEVMSFEGKPWVVSDVKLRYGKKAFEGEPVAAEDIVRVYCKQRRYYDSRERWKERGGGYGPQGGHRGGPRDRSSVGVRGRKARSGHQGGSSGPSRGPGGPSRGPGGPSRSPGGPSRGPGGPSRGPGGSRGGSGGRPKSRGPPRRTVSRQKSFKKGRE